MFEGWDINTSDSSIHYGWNSVHAGYNSMVTEKVKKLLQEALENNWDDKLLKKKIQNLQRDLKKDLKMGAINVIKIIYNRYNNKA